jgi:predicted RNA-binding protein with TRAM domain
MARFGRRGFKFRPRVNIPKPVKVGEEYDVEIKEVGSKGDGIARIKNFVVFVNGARKGEKTRIKITQVRNRFALGEKISKEETKEEFEEKEFEPTEEVKEVTEEKIAEVEEEESA